MKLSVALVAAVANTFLSRVLGTTSSEVGCYRAGDGSCDSAYNREECDWDGGDCCSCDCVEADDDVITEPRCGQFGYDCINPTSSCFGDEDDFVPCWTAGDGWCDSAYNREECDWDGGDCCSCDCVYDDDDMTPRCGQFGYDCINPTSSCFGDEDDFVPCYSEGDGWCDSAYNREECNWDGGDCCECDCDDGDDDVSTESRCGQFGYDCMNPDSTCSEAAENGSGEGVAENGSGEGDPVGAVLDGVVGGVAFVTALGLGA